MLYALCSPLYAHHSKLTDGAKACKKDFMSWGKSLIFYSFLVLYFAILIYLSNEINIWEDEVYSLNTTSNNLSNVVSQSYNFEAQPPVYFILLALWRHINTGICFARVLSLIFIGLSAYFLSKLVSLVSDIESSRWFVIIFLLNPFTVWAALEIRTYALLIFLSSISIYYFLNFYASNKNYHLYSFLIISIIGVYTQYFFVFLIIALAFSLLVFKGWRAFFKLCFYLIPVVLLFLPNLLFLPEGLSRQQTNNPDYSVLDGLYKVFQSPPKLILALNVVPSGNGLKLVIIILFIFFGIYTYFKAYKKHLILCDLYFERYNLILVSALIIVILYSIVVVITRMVYADKYMAIAFPFFILLFTLFQVHSSFIRTLIYGTITIFFLSLLIITYIHPIKIYDFKSVAKYISKIERTGEPILFYRNAMSLPFTYYYKGLNPLVPLPNPVRFDNTYLKNIKDTLELKRAITGINAKSNSYLIISDDNTDYAYNVNFNRKMVDDYLIAHYNITLDTLCFGEGPEFFIRIRRLEKSLPFNTINNVKFLF
jgi:hypothetical protein